MSTSQRVLSKDEIDRLPAWAAEIARKYFAGEASHFLLHRNSAPRGLHALHQSNSFAIATRSAATLPMGSARSIARPRNAP